jgi:monoamine oxidase
MTRSKMKSQAKQHTPILSSSISRRAFCQATLLASATALTRGAAMPNGKTVIVIGAGMAGLAAAIDLKAAGFTVIVVEGRERVGGRVFTDTSLDGLPLDLGANWIHGIHRNPIFELTTKFRIKTAVTNYDSIARYASDGQALDDARGARLERDFEQLQTAIARAQDDEDGDRPLGQFIDAYTARLKLASQRAQDLAYSVNAEIEHDYAADVDDLSLLEFDQDSELGGADVLFPGGYTQLVERLKIGLDIRTGQVVRSVVRDRSGVRILTSSAAFAADFAVITLPLGVLKQGSVAFIPELPTSKIGAIARLGMSVLNKCCLRFPNAFWHPRTHLLGYVNAARDQWSAWLNIYRYTGQPVLVGFNAGSFGEQLETLSDAAITASAMKVLRRIYGASIPDPTGVRITRWKSDAFTRGSYSHIPPGASGDDYDALAASVDARLFFAGEATSRIYPGTVHGAWLSGRKAAREIAARREISFLK